MFVGLLDGPKLNPKTPRWARWQDVHGIPGDDQALPPLFRCCDRGLQRYDFKTRKYKIPDANTWSYVKYPVNHGQGDHNADILYWDPAGNPVHVVNGLVIWG